MVRGRQDYEFLRKIVCFCNGLKKFNLQIKAKKSLDYHFLFFFWSSVFLGCQYNFHILDIITS